VYSDGHVAQLTLGPAAPAKAVYPDLAGSVALITGGGGGIGRATALALAASGVQVAITEVPGRTELARRTTTDIRETGGTACDLALDVRQTFAIGDVVNRVADTFGRLDVLVNNAGVQLFKPALQFEEEEFDEVLSVNLRGAFFCAQAAAALMIEARRGVIINVASQHGVIGNVNRAAYTASKGGLISLTRALAVEWAPYGIRVNAVSPTFTSNDNNAELLAAESFQREIRARVLFQRPASAEEVAASICFLASSGASMITGHNLLVDGGWTAS